MAVGAGVGCAKTRARARHGLIAADMNVGGGGGGGGQPINTILATRGSFRFCLGLHFARRILAADFTHTHVSAEARKRARVLSDVKRVGWHRAYAFLY